MGWLDICTFDDYYKGVCMYYEHVDFLKNDVEMDQVKGKCEGQKSQSTHSQRQRFLAIKRKKKENVLHTIELNQIKKSSVCYLSANESQEETRSPRKNIRNLYTHSSITLLPVC